MKPLSIHLTRRPAMLRPAGFNGVAGTVTGTAEARGGMIPDPARIPPRQPVRVPLRVPADTGNPASGEGAGSGRNKPSGGLPDRYGVKPVKQ